MDTVKQRSGLGRGQDVTSDALEACRFIVKFHNEVFPTGRPLTIDGKPIDHTAFNKAYMLAETALAKAEDR